MGDEEAAHPERYLGVTHGAYWSAIRPEGAEERADEEEEDYSCEGIVLRIMWGEDAGPLWGDGGLLGEDAPQDMTTLHFGRPPADDWDDRGEQLRTYMAVSIRAARPARPRRTISL